MGGVARAVYLAGKSNERMTLHVSSWHCMPALVRIPTTSRTRESVSLDPTHQPPTLRTPTRVALAEARALVDTGLSLFHKRPSPPSALPHPGRRPVLLVHGYLGHPGQLYPLGRDLLTHGWGVVDYVRYRSLFWSFERIVGEVAKAARRLHEEHGPIDLVGHSLGAIVCLAWIQLGDGDKYVHRLVSIAGPHRGTLLHPFVPSPIRDALNPDGPWLPRLDPHRASVSTTVIRAHLDHQVVPPSRARLTDATEITLPHAGHNSLLWSPQTHQAVRAALSRSDYPAEDSSET